MDNDTYWKILEEVHSLIGYHMSLKNRPDFHLQPELHQIIIQTMILLSLASIDEQRLFISGIVTSNTEKTIKTMKEMKAYLVSSIDETEGESDNAKFRF